MAKTKPPYTTPEARVRRGRAALIVALLHPEEDTPEEYEKVMAIARRTVTKVLGEEAGVAWDKAGRKDEEKRSKGCDAGTASGGSSLTTPEARVRRGRAVLIATQLLDPAASVEDFVNDMTMFREAMIETFGPEAAAAWDKAGLESEGEDS